MEVALISVKEKLQHLKAILQESGPTLIAFSGGVDSSFLLAVAAEVLKENVVALMTISSSTPPEDVQQAKALTASLQVQMLTLAHDELAIPQYAANPTNRCYFCKDSLYAICRREADRLSLRSIADGVNTDDLRDYRPGLQAANEYGIAHPLVAAAFTKADIRQASRTLELSTWDQPASPCLSSRVPYGTPITARMLAQIAQGESFLRSLGFTELRVRHHGQTARIELRKEDFSRIASVQIISRVKTKMQELGFSSTLLDINGYRSGVFNEGLKR